MFKFLLSVSKGTGVSGSLPDGVSERLWLQTSPFTVVPPLRFCTGNVLLVPVLCPRSGHILTESEITCVEIVLRC